jgi:hypothetical protein
MRSNLFPSGQVKNTPAVAQFASSLLAGAGKGGAPYDAGQQFMTGGGKDAAPVVPARVAPHTIHDHPIIDRGGSMDAIAVGALNWMQLSCAQLMALPQQDALILINDYLNWGGRWSSASEMRLGVFPEVSPTDPAPIPPEAVGAVLVGIRDYCARLTNGLIQPNQFLLPNTGPSDQAGRQGPDTVRGVGIENEALYAMRLSCQQFIDIAQSRTDALARVRAWYRTTERAQHAPFAALGNVDENVVSQLFQQILDHCLAARYRRVRESVSQVLAQPSAAQSKTSVVKSSGQIAPTADLTPHQMLVRSDLVSYFALGGVILGIGLGIVAHSK